jgi:hypothetical protein
MGDTNTSLVDTHIELADAPQAARTLCRNLIERGVIDPILSGCVPFSLGSFFPVRSGFAGFDAAIEPQFRPRIQGVDIEETGHVWRNGEDGVPYLVRDAEGSNGIFFNCDEPVMTCPTCGHTIEFKQKNMETIGRVLTAWCEQPDVTPMTCTGCERDIPLRVWRSKTNSFAVGHLGFTLWSAHVMDLVERPPTAAGTGIRRLIGDHFNRFTVVFCSI